MLLGSFSASSPVASSPLEGALLKYGWHLYFLEKSPAAVRLSILAPLGKPPATAACGGRLRRPPAAAAFGGRLRIVS